MHPDDVITVINAMNTAYWSIENGNSIESNTSVKINLSSVSTSDLLNEAFKRGAIRQMEFWHSIPNEYMQAPQYEEHLIQRLVHDSLRSSADKLLADGVFNIGKKEQPELGEIHFSADYFICRHPITLKKSK
jgi:hypothetical protein